MTFEVQSGVQQGFAEVIATSGRGLNPEELTRMILPKLITIDPDIPDERRPAAEAQRERARALLEHYFAQAQKSQNTTIFNVLMNAGHADAAELVKDL
jgi:hypothetical protein